MRPMGKNSTLIVYIDKKNAHGKTEVIDVKKFIEETDNFLHDFFRNSIVKVSNKLIKKTLTKCLKS